MATDLITVRELDGDDTDDDLYPLVDLDKSCRLAAGERIAWQGSADATFLRKEAGGTREAWSLPEAADVLVTSSRVIYLCGKFVKGSTYFGGAAGIWTAASAASAAVQRHGRVAAGHVRFQWPASVMMEEQFLRFGGRNTYVWLTCQDGTAPGAPFVMLRLRIARDAAAVTELLVRSIAEFRLGFRFKEPLSEEVLERLRALVAGAPPTKKTQQKPPRREYQTYLVPGSLKVPDLGT